MEEKKEPIAAFVELLAQLGGELRTLYREGNAQALTDMNATIKEMYRLQHGSEDDAFKTIDPDCEVIYRNFDMIVAVLRTTENGEIDRGAQTAINKFLHNIDEAVVGIVSALGIV